MGVTLSVFNREITYTDQELIPLQIKGTFREKAMSYHDRFLAKYNEWGNIVNTLKNAEDQVYEYASEISNEIINNLLNQGVYTYSTSMILENYLDLSNFYNALDEITDEYESFVRSTEEDAEYRRYRKESRGRVVGGGFGLDGAVKGMATAGAINIATGVLHGTFNMLGDMISTSSEHSMKRKLYETPETAEKLAYGLTLDINIFALTYLLILNKELHTDYKVTLSTEEKQRYNSILENLDRIPNEEHQLNAAVELLRINPEDQDLYYKLLLIFGDPNNELDTFGEHFNIDVDTLKANIAFKKINKLQLAHDDDIVDYLIDAGDIIDTLNISIDNTNLLNDYVEAKAEEQRCKDYNYVLSKRYKELYLEVDGDLNSALEKILKNSDEKIRKYISTQLYNETLFNKKQKYFINAFTADEVPLLIISDDVNTILISNKNFYYKLILEGTKYFPMVSISKVAVNYKDIIINEHITIEGALPKSELYEEFQNLFNDVIAFVKHTYKPSISEITPKTLFDQFFGNLKNKALQEKILLPSTNSKQLQSAINTFANITPNEEVLFFFDDTIWNSGKKGSVFTDKRIFMSDGKTNTVINYIDIVAFTYRKSGNFILDIEAQVKEKVITIIIPPLTDYSEKKHSREYLKEFLEELVDLSKVNKENSHPSKGNSTIEKTRLAINETEELSNIDSYEDEIDGTYVEEPSTTDKKTYKDKIIEAFGIGTVNTNLQGKVYFYLDKSNSKTMKKFNNVLNSYASIGQNEEPILLFDNTVFGSAKDGFLMTDKAIYWHNVMSDAKKFAYEQVRSVELRKNVLLLNGEEISLDMLDKKDGDKLIQIFYFIFNN